MKNETLTILISIITGMMLGWLALVYTMNIWVQPAPSYAECVEKTK